MIGLHFRIAETDEASPRHDLAASGFVHLVADEIRLASALYVAPA
ncbi:MAG: hypothetical protein ACKVIQ_16995 [Acidimicrobiales bacterium]